MSTFTSLLSNPRYYRTKITLLDTRLPSLSSYGSQSSKHNGHKYDNEPIETTEWPPQNPHAASIDSSRIVRSDYAKAAYTRLAAGGQEQWRTGYGSCGIYKIKSGLASPGERPCRIKNCDHSAVYKEGGLILTAGKQESEYVKKAKKNAEDLGLRVQGLGNPAEIMKVLERGSIGPHDTSTNGSGVEDDSQNKVLAEKSAYVGETGYVNWSSGWVDNGRAMANVLVDAIRASLRRNRDSCKGQITFVQGKASQLLFASQDGENRNRYPSSRDKDVLPVEGVVLDDPASTTIKASLTILATGASTSAFLDLRDHVVATGQPVAYVPITASEAAALEHMPLLLNLTTGFFIVPPVPNRPSTSVSTTPGPRLRSKGEGKLGEETETMPFVLKVAHHTFGYVNPTPVTLPLLSNISKSGEKGEREGRTIYPSLPSPHFSPIPSSAEQILLQHLSHALPRHPSLSRLTFPSASSPRSSSSSPSYSSGGLMASTRLCYYTDTPHGDFLITCHPTHPHLFLATGGSGHGFKFLPVLGDKIVEAIEGTLEPELADLWTFHSQHQVHTSPALRDCKGGGGKREWWSCEDGSRAGRRGVLLEQAFREDMENEGVEETVGRKRSKL